MKKVLSLLMAFLFLQTETWALSGGPFSNGFNSSSLVGTYAGVMIGTVPPGGVGAVGGSGLGIFTIGLPQGGIGTGIFALYSGGNTIGGDVIGLGDPKDQTIRGVMSGIFIPNTTSTAVVIVGVSQTTVGAQFNAKVKGSSSKGVTNASRLIGTAGATITYTDFSIGTVIVSTDFTLVGYKQSTDPNAATSVDLPDTFSGKSN
jgi:hypothetical protein